jgi:hypothetical protein
MSAPTAAHDRRVADLEALAILSGHRHPFDFPRALRPDVARVDHHNATIFIADGKHSESPGCSATAIRFAAYLVVARSWIALGYDVTVAVGHPPQHDAWASFLEQLCARLQLDVAESGNRVLALDMAISWARIGSRSRVRPPDP